MVSGFRKINQTQSTFLQNKYLIEVGLSAVCLLGLSVQSAVYPYKETHR